MSNILVHFEIPGDDPEALAEFYRNLFGWKIQKAPMDYWLIETAPGGQGIGGGMMKRQAPEQGPVNYVGVESVDVYRERAEQLGARVILPKQAVPGVGYFSIILDPQGNPLGMFQDDPSAR